mmetsp:Transcript_10484/g.26032  ORF Transcript_10484/g.26032 Transcript_10484/m.26032 type:complete len:89 (-) Transcript_10484:594-860(-)
MAGFKIPLDAYVLVLPITYACCALGGLVVKTLTTDPEMSTMKYYENTPEDKVARDAMAWNDGVEDMFRKRIAANKFSVFGTNFFCSKQ